MTGAPAIVVANAAQTAANAALAAGSGGADISTDYIIFGFMVFVFVGAIFIGWRMWMNDDAA